MPVKLDKRDKLFSVLVREGAAQRCEACGATEALTCSHHVSRKYMALRWSPDNAVCHCFSCHRIFTDNPLKHADWIREHVGEEMYESLKERARPVTKLSKADKEDIYENLKNSWNFMQQQRREGAEGRLEFSSPYE